MSLLDVVDIEIGGRRRVRCEGLKSGPVVTKRQLGLGWRLLLAAASLGQYGLDERKIVQVSGHDAVLTRHGHASCQETNQAGADCNRWEQPLHRCDLR